jgi:hypothetical protein
MRNLNIALALFLTTGWLAAQPVNPRGGDQKYELFGKRGADDVEDPNGRAITGTVTADGTRVIAGAVVHLINRQNKRARSTVAASDGTYRFNGLRLDADYELKAEFDGTMGAAKVLSQYDTAKKPVRNLTVPPASGKKKTGT